jgi:hypothetical protein
MEELTDLIHKYYGELNPERWEACEHAMPESTSCIDCSQKQYFHDNHISYDCDQKRKIYVLRYLPVHQKEVYLALAMVPPKFHEDFAAKKQLSILSIGSGPGSDIFAFKTLLNQGLIPSGGVAEIVVNFVEKETGWDRILNETTGITDGDTRYSYDKLYLDFSADEFECNQSFDYLVLSYLISELNERELENTARNLQNCIRNLSVLIINDRKEDDVIRKIRRLLRFCNVQWMIEMHDRVHCGVSYPDELRSELKPKLKTNSTRYTVVVTP